MKKTSENKRLRLLFGCTWSNIKWSKEFKTGKKMVHEKGFLCQNEKSLVSRTDHK